MTKGISIFFFFLLRFVYDDDADGFFTQKLSQYELAQARVSTGIVTASLCHVSVCHVTFLYFC